MKKLIALIALLIPGACGAQGIPLRLSLEIDGQCASRVAYFFTEHVERAKDFVLDPMSPLHLNLRVTDVRSRFGLGTGTCRYSAKVAWNAYGLEGADTRAVRRFSGTLSARGGLSETLIGDVARSGEARAAREIHAWIGRIADERGLKRGLASG